MGTLDGQSHLDRIETSIDLTPTETPQLFL